MRQKKEGLRAFQKQVRQLVTEGENVIIHVPTGAGKTRAALTPFMDNLEKEGDMLPHHCLYATPMRVLSSQFHHLYQGILTHMDNVKGTDFFRQYGYELLGDAMVSIQTGEQQDDPQFEALLTFCTIDQLLASFLGVPYSVGRRLANINVGAVLSSYLVLDEFHLYPLLNEGESSFGARTTTLAMLSLLSGITRFVLMTATLSTELLQQMAQLLQARVVTMDAAELEEISEGRQRWFEVAEGSMAPEQILSRHDRCSLVVCNTVSRAQSTYWALRTEAEARGIQLELLHSRLTDTDRADRSQRIIEALGPENWQRGVYQREQGIIVVATQVVEVGLDISVETLHTEVAPANSLIQRAGRCARYAQQKGHVIVYDLPKKNGKPTSWRPYDKARCMATMDELKKRDAQQPMDFFAEQALINAVHTQEDRELLARFRKQRGEIEKQIFVGLKEGSTSVLTTLIRDVAQVQVIIHDDPKKEVKSEPWRYQSFSLHPASLAKYLTMVEPKKDAYGLEWVCKEAVAEAQEQTGEEDTRAVTIYDWPSVGFIADQHALAKYLRGTIMLALPNQLATYHDELGFVLRDDAWEESLPWPVYQSPRLDRRGPRYQSKPIRCQSYQEHISGLIQAYNSGIAQSLAYVARQLEIRMGLPQEQIDHAIRLAIACHDVGKLGEQWQRWAYEWQTLLYAQMGWQPFSSDPTFFFAKTDYDSHDHEQRQWQSKVKVSRPRHACESVRLTRSLIAESLGITSGDDPLLRAICGAIARHHSAQAMEYTPICLKDGALGAVQEALEIARQTHAWSFELPRLKTTLERSGSLAPSDTPLITLPERGKRSELETWLYYVIVRALRLADQRADDFNRR